jgi:hypothetical protein
VPPCSIRAIIRARELHDHPRRIAGSIALIFALCAIVDFILGYIRGRTMSAGAISVVLGLFGTTFYWFLIRGSKDRDE